VIDRVDPTAQSTAVLGDVTVIDGVPVAIVKLALDESRAVPELLCAVTRIRAVLVPPPVGVQLQLVAELDNPTHPGTAVNVVPPFRESATSNEAGAPPLDHRIIVGTFTKTFSPPFGASTVTKRGDAVMVTFTVAMLLSRVPSLALNVNVSVPDAPGFGV
jgi:hypothetical protein